MNFDNIYSYSTLDTDEKRREWIADFFARKSAVLRDTFPRRYVCKASTFADYVVEKKNPDQARAKAVCERFANNLFDRVMKTDPKKSAGTGLILAGNSGTGKTHLASAVLIASAKAGISGFYTTAADIFDACNSHDKAVPTSRLVELLSTVGVLVIDELGLSSWTPAERKRLQQIFEERISNDLPTVFVTNLDEKELNAAIGERLVSRIYGNCYPLAFLWSDYRKQSSPATKDPKEVF